MARLFVFVVLLKLRGWARMAHDGVALPFDVVAWLLYVRETDRIGATLTVLNPVAMVLCLLHERAPPGATTHHQRRFPH